MAMAPRTQLVPIDNTILSSYQKGGVAPASADRSALLRLGAPAGRMTPDAAAGLLALNNAVLEAGGDLRITDCFRDIAQQTAKRAEYEAKLAAGENPPYVARPGRSNHNAGRAVDINVGALKLASKKSLYLDKLWPIAKACGFTPIIKDPDEGAKESWHFDFWGEWAPVLARVGYEQASMCACLDIGVTIYSLARERTIQANLHRAGYNVGDIDGVIGKRTLAALQQAGITETQTQLRLEAVLKLPSSPVLLTA